MLPPPQQPSPVATSCLSAGTQGYKLQAFIPRAGNHRALFVRNCTAYTGTTEFILHLIASPDGCASPQPVIGMSRKLSHLDAGSFSQKFRISLSVSDTALIIMITVRSSHGRPALPCPPPWTVICACVLETDVLKMDRTILNRFLHWSAMAHRCSTPPIMM